MLGRKIGDRIDVGDDTIDGRLELSISYAFLDKFHLTLRFNFVAESDTPLLTSLRTTAEYWLSDIPASFL